MTESRPSVNQILTEWTIAEPAADRARWQEGIRRYEAESLDDYAAMGAAAELMCAALTHYVADGSIITDTTAEPPETALVQTVWNVLVATLHGGSGNSPSTDSDKCLRLALAATRRGQYQSGDLGGNGLMAEAFDEDSRILMTAALSDLSTGAEAPPAELMSWFTASETSKPILAMPGSETGNTTQSGESPAGERGTPSGIRWGALKKRAQEAKQHVNPLALQHGIESLQGALTEAQIAKTDRSGRLKIRKFGAAKAALRPTKTLRRALDGAAVTEHLKAYKESIQAHGRQSGGEAGNTIAAKSAAGTETSDPTALDPASFVADFDRYSAQLDAKAPKDPGAVRDWLKTEIGDYDPRNAAGMAIEWYLDRLADSQPDSRPGRPSSRVARITHSWIHLESSAEAKKVLVRLGEDLYDEGALAGPYDERSINDDADEPLWRSEAGPARLLALMTLAVYGHDLGHPRAAEWITAARAGIPTVPSSIFYENIRALWARVDGPL